MQNCVILWNLLQPPLLFALYNGASSSILAYVENNLPPLSYRAWILYYSGSSRQFGVIVQI